MKRNDERRVLPRADREGYLLDGKPVDGFADRPQLPRAERETIARLAKRFAPEAMSDTQRALLTALEQEPRGASAKLRGFSANEGYVDDLFLRGFFQLLSPQQLELVAHPERKAGSAYPLTVGQLAKLTGTTPRQIRHWTDLQILPEQRADGDRLYYSAAAAYAMVLAPLDKFVIAALAVLNHRGRETPRLLTVFGSSLTTLAQDLPATSPAVESLVAAGEALQRSATELSSTPHS